MMLKVVKTTLLISLFMLTAAVGTYLSVHLLIRNEKTVVTPDVVGKEVVYALELLTDLQLNTKVKGSRFDSTVPRHHIITQDPEPGTEIKQGRDVRLIISKGTRNVIFPKLKGISLAQARILLNENGLVLGHVSRIYTNLHSRQEVLSQFPTSVHQGLRGDRVDLLISEGPEPVWYRMMPLNGMTLNGAVSVIEQNQMALASVKYTQDASVTERTVTHQDPPPGYPVASTANIELTVALRSAAPVTDGRDKASLYRYRAPEGFINQSVRVRINWPAMTLDVYNDYVRPSGEIWLLVANTSSATLFLYADDQLIETQYYK